MKAAKRQTEPKSHDDDGSKTKRKASISRLSCCLLREGAKAFSKLFVYKVNCQKHKSTLHLTGLSAASNSTECFDTQTFPSASAATQLNQFIKRAATAMEALNFPVMSLFF